MFLAKISKVLIMMENGTVKDHYGKSLDEIVIGNTSELRLIWLLATLCMVLFVSNC